MVDLHADSHRHTHRLVEALFALLRARLRPGMGGLNGFASRSAKDGMGSEVPVCQGALSWRDVGVTLQTSEEELVAKLQQAAHS